MQVVQISIGNGWNSKMDEGTVLLMGETGSTRIKLKEEQIIKLLTIARTFMPEIFTAHIDAMKNARTDLLAIEQ